MSEKEKYYVVMTDKAMSGWGRAQGKINKLIFECDTHEQAQIVEKNARNRSEMKYINVTRNKPRYNSNYLVQEYKFTEDDNYSNWYKPNFGR